MYARPMPSSGPHGGTPRPQRCPVVEMTNAEALALSAAVSDARQRLVTEVARIGRSRSMGHDQKKAAVALLRKHLAALQEFHAAHMQAHEIGGY